MSFSLASVKPDVRDAGVLVPAVLAFTAFIPPEIALNLFGIVLMPYRLVLLIAIGPALVRLWRHRAFNLFDLAMAFYAIPVFASMIYNHGLQSGLASGGLAVLETTGSYLIARAFISSFSGFRAFAETWVVLAIVFLPLLMAESAAHRDLVHSFARSLMGGASGADLSNTHSTSPINLERFGLYRAAGPFAHPILCGVAYVMFTPYVLLIQRGAWRAISLVCLVAGFALTVSTDPVLTLGIEVSACFGLYWNGTRQWKSPLQMILLVGIPLWIVLDTIASRPLFTVLATRLAFDAQTGYYRTLIWQYGLNNVAAHPVFGLGYGDWARPIWMVARSVDAYWLVVAMRHGVGAVALFAGSCLVALARMLTVYGREAWRKPGLRAVGAVVFSILLGMGISGVTVDYWGAMAMIVPIMLGVTVNILAGHRLRAPAEAQMRAPAAVAEAA